MLPWYACIAPPITCNPMPVKVTRPPVAPTEAPKVAVGIFTTLDKHLVRKSLGRLHETDRASLKAAVQVILG